MDQHEAALNDYDAQLEMTPLGESSVKLHTIIFADNLIAQLQSSKSKEALEVIEDTWMAAQQTWQQLCAKTRDAARDLKEQPLKRSERKKRVGIAREATEQ